MGSRASRLHSLAKSKPGTVGQLFGFLDSSCPCRAGQNDFDFGIEMIAASQIFRVTLKLRPSSRGIAWIRLLQAAVAPHDERSEMTCLLRPPVLTVRNAAMILRRHPEVVKRKTSKQKQNSSNQKSLWHFCRQACTACRFRVLCICTSHARSHAKPR